jgi:hypothetical protein
MRGICKCVSMAVKLVSVCEHRRREPEADGRRGGVVHADLWKDQRDVMHLVAPEIHVRVRVEDAASRAQHVLRCARRPRDAEARREVVVVDVDEAFGIPVLAADERDRRALAEIEFVRILLMSCNGVWISCRNPALIVSAGETRSRPARTRSRSSDA